MAGKENNLVATVPRLAGLPVIPNRQAGSLSHHSSQAPTRIVYYDKTFENYSSGSATDGLAGQTTPELWMNGFLGRVFSEPPSLFPTPKCLLR